MTTGPIHPDHCDVPSAARAAAAAIAASSSAFTSETAELSRYVQLGTDAIDGAFRGSRTGGSDADESVSVEVRKWRAVSGKVSDCAFRLMLHEPIF